MATFTYDIASPGPADGSPSPQLHTVHLLEAYTPDPRSDEEPQHLLPMPMPVPVPFFSASGELSKDAASEAFADFSALPSTVSGLDDINWDEWILFDSPPVNVPPPSLQLSDISDDPIEEAHRSPSDVADGPPNQREPTPPLASDNREGNTLKEPLNYSDDCIEADPRPGKEPHVQTHRPEQVTRLASNRWEGDALGETLHNQEYIILPLSQVKILKLVYKRDGDEMYQIVGRIDLQETRGYGTQGKPWKCLGSAEDPIIIDGPMSPNLLSDSDPFVAIPSLQRNIERVPGGYKVYAKMTLDDLQEHGGLGLLAAYWNIECRRMSSIPGKSYVPESYAKVVANRTHSAEEECRKKTNNPGDT
ncbi:predicted protein [Histoplasma mississippiense (nom. inval.)]|uniref:predicted protein n=1 Tax=Ajellomyces capsulatus (strain NAm1 / WU24) TaxID=2059318 RepID=UPI000157BEB5|nr:predicted protein [Histoplasma mississippiense (nom. inval.)]EDN06468.1 predicted protein [Histoplasma mississippiense (nom. inval.)]